jgi:hypothetical protein
VDNPPAQSTKKKNKKSETLKNDSTTDDTKAHTTK